MLNAAGRFFFRYRNALFPVIVAALLVAFPPRPFGARWWDSLAIAGIVAVLLGESLRIITIGLDYVKRGGKKKMIYADRLVTGGVYAHARNPMYVGNLLVVLGLLCVTGQPWAIASGAAFFLFAYISIVHGEENYLRERFGDEYREYCRRSPRWIPHVGGLLATIRKYRFDWPAVVVKEYGTIFVTLFMTTGVLAWKAARGGLLEKDWLWFATAGAVWVAFWALARWMKKGLNMKARGTTPAGATMPELRKKIDAIDDRILELLNERASYVSAIFVLKRNAAVQRFDAKRTDEILDRLANANLGPLPDEDVRRLFGKLLWYFAHEYERPAGVPQSPVDERHAPEIEIVPQHVPA